MRVLVYDGPHQFHVEERPVPEPGPGEVRLRLSHIGICGSDLHGYTGESGRRVAGMVMGHEASGWVDAVGDGVTPVADVVTFNPAVACAGSCGHRVENQCSELLVYGVTPSLQGAFADYMVVPAHRIVPAPGLSPEWAAGVEPMAVAIQASRRTRVGAGDRVLIVGGGMIGQCIAQAARMDGAAEVVISEPDEERRRIAAGAGFAAVAPDGVAGLAPFDRAVDAVGVSATAAAAIRAVPKGGTVCFVGLGLPDITIPLFDVVVAEREIVGSFCYPDAVFVEAARRLEAGDLDLAPLIGQVVPFAEAHDAFEGLADGSRHQVKIMVSTT